jgi:hypothetical protein
MPLLWNLEKMIIGSTIDNFIALIFISLMEYGA